MDLYMKVGIIGGSIAGLAAAILLRELGLEVTVLERSKHSLSTRGAGIVLQESFVKQCVDACLFSSDIPRVPFSGRSFNTQANQRIFEQPLVGLGLNWSDIYNQLRCRLPDDHYLQGQVVSEVKFTPEQCQVTTQRGKGYTFDYLVAADGFHSTLSPLVFPKHNTKFTGYVAWRGTIASSDLENTHIFDKHVPYYVYPNGHILIYRIPSPDFEQTKETLLNWVMYTPMRHRDIDYASSISPKHISEDQITKLHHLAKESLPKEISDMVTQTKEPFLQAIYDGTIPAPYQSRTFFIGDCAAVLRPHTASGAFKAINDAMSLQQLFSDELTPQAIEQWAAAQNNQNNEQLILARRMSEALVMDTPAWEKMTPKLMETWWQSVVAGKQWHLTVSQSPQVIAHQFELKPELPPLSQKAEHDVSTNKIAPKIATLK